MIRYFNILIQLSISRCLLNIIKVDDASYFIEKVLYCLEIRIISKGRKIHLNVIKCKHILSKNLTILINNEFFLKEL